MDCWSIVVNVKIMMRGRSSINLVHSIKLSQFTWWRDFEGRDIGCKL